MAPSITSIAEEDQSVSWSLQSFAVSNDFRSPGPANLLLDRANSEFGIIYQTAPGIATMAQFPDTDEPVYFQVSRALCVMMQHLQLNLVFTTADYAAEFLQLLGRLATKVGNSYFEIYEAPSNAALSRADFSMEKQGFTNQITQTWMAIPYADTTEWARIYQTGKCSDFTIIAGSRVFPVHRVLLSSRSQYFDAVCDGRFTETEQRSIKLPENENIIAIMLQEIYEVYNTTTGSIFTGFALGREIEKDRVINDLLALFIACDKYNLESIKQRVAAAIIDRLPFIHDSLSIVDLAGCLYDENYPKIDRGLRKATIKLLQARLPAIMEDEDAWKEFSDNKVVLKAFHAYQCEITDSEFSTGVHTPPATPTKNMPSVDPNVLEVVFGSLLIKPWYPSFYPEELVGRRVERLYVCQWCFKYSKELMGFLGHLKACPLGKTPPPGVNVYTNDNYSLYEIDGEKHKLYAQNLCLFAKLFLDTKSVFYDVTTFLYYLLVAHSPTPGISHTNLGKDRTDREEIGAQGQVVGFFSKEKMSWDNNNLACILVFPPWQKQGLGQILMGASYEMSGREGRLGGPEKPLSDLGRLAYTHYWSATLARTILSCPSKKILTVLDLRDKTYIVPEDIIATLQAMDVLDHRKRGSAEAVINKAKVRAWAESNKVDLKGRPVDPEAFVMREVSRNGSEES
ncbi:histone acetyltransferase MYST2 [Cucurbitaria berberidis CBS 394.84]|uniref:histone acetyltransferase n=1 Tax=Cucurbitaria berberidis CBS 394.84 TaxID=1168544 RepID=A0A9P4GL28_9PLEO|nr:histone acetyltransferase MYST2 [Cucurbitaria berberidis CBS 394.84]KAF1848313.1 histone acetyltransferase MYST2 [Cucurbitaria berberidis CBS 394.84]